MWSAKRLLAGGLLIGAGTGFYFSFLKSREPRHQSPFPNSLDAIKPGVTIPAAPPNRSAQLERLQSGQCFDLLVIGGGATGTGVALEAASRGLSVALVEREDFSSGTSSRSTKLIHGGVRYLENAVKDLDFEQFQLVREALHERKTLLKIAPHLSYEIPILLPVYRWWEAPYFWVGAKVYDLLAGKQGLQASYFLSRESTLEIFPVLNSEKLKCSIVYHDGAHNDSRMNVTIALSAAAEGAAIANYVEVKSLLKKKTDESSSKIYGAVVQDTLSGKTWEIYAKGVVNATGPFTDHIRKMGSESSETICAPSSGVHVVLPSYYCPQTMGLIDPSTSDGRVIFFLPWEGSTIAGTTDAPLKDVPTTPSAQEDEIRFILKEVSKHLSPEVDIRREDVLAAWCGVRPLVRDPSVKFSKRVSRNHVVHVSEEGLLTIAGGKWTTFRKMAEDTVEKAIHSYGLKPERGSVTCDLPLFGGHQHSRTLFVLLIHKYGLSQDVAQHLVKSYGDRAPLVLSYDENPNNPPILHPQYPYLESEVRYSVRDEYACSVVDVLARRLRLAFLNPLAAVECLGRTIEIMGQELGWSEDQKKLEGALAVSFLMTMGLRDSV